MEMPGLTLASLLCCPLGQDAAFPVKFANPKSRHCPYDGGWKETPEALGLGLCVLWVELRSRLGLQPGLWGQEAPFSRERRSQEAAGLAERRTLQEPPSPAVGLPPQLEVSARTQTGGLRKPLDV